MIAWMLYATFVGALIVVGARAAEWVGRIAGIRVRWVWAASIVAVLLLSLSPRRRGADVATGLTLTPTAANARLREVPADSWMSGVALKVNALRGGLDERLREGIAVVQHAAPPAANGYAFAIWAAFTVALIALIGIVNLRFRRARQAWPRQNLQGVDVRVAQQVGPVVLGFVQPEIVVPRWLLDRTPDDQRLVVAHEHEHVRARDPMLLGFGWMAVIAAPWNPALWYMLSRLRLAVELDCDARVLRRGATPRSYGSLLIDVAENASAFRFSALALADHSSHLHQRILAMKPRMPRFALVRGGAVAALGVVAILAACEAKLPTAAEIDQMDAGSAERAAVRFVGDTVVTYEVDGKLVTSERAHALSSDSIASVEVVRSAGEAAQIRMRTKSPTAAGPLREVPVFVRRDASSDTTLPLVVRGRGARVGGPGNGLEERLAPLPNGKNPPLFMIDGVRATQSAVTALDRKSIESIEVLKGPAAAAQYGPDAAAGVITIKTKRGGSPE